MKYCLLLSFVIGHLYLVVTNDYDYRLLTTILKDFTNPARVAIGFIFTVKQSECKLIRIHKYILNYLAVSYNSLIYLLKKYFSIK